jgi:hypothetical protein
MKMFEQGEIGSAIVVFKVYEKWKAVVVHGHNEGESEYGESSTIAINRLKDKLLSKSSFKHTKFIVNVANQFSE